jgi:hypothetical protein
MKKKCYFYEIIENFNILIFPTRQVTIRCVMDHMFVFCILNNFDEINLLQKT